MRHLFLFFGLFVISCCRSSQPVTPKSEESLKKKAVQMVPKKSVLSKTVETNSAERKIVIGEEDLLPPKKNPAQAYVEMCPKAGFTISHKIIDIFNNFDSTESSKRHYDFVSFLDGITIGMGHWPQAEARYFFGNLNKHPEAKKRFIKEALIAFKERSDKECRGYLSGKVCNHDNLQQLLETTLFNQKFLIEKYGKNCQLNSKYLCSSGPNLFYDLPWVKYVLGRALRDKAVTQWQLGFFEQDIIGPASVKAKASGLQDKSESILIFSSFESSFKRYSSELMKVGKTNGFLEFGRYRYYWSQPKGIKNPTADQLQAWRMLLAFRWYQYIKGQRAKRPDEKGCAYPLRDRMRHLYCKHLQKPWSKYWPNARLGAESCDKITDRITKLGGCQKILARESIVPPGC